MAKFNDGDEVLVENPGPLYGTVRVRPADKNLPENERYYIVKFSEEKIYRFAHLTAIEEPPMKRGDAAWFKELNHAQELLSKWQADQTNQQLFKEFAESLRKLGWIVPKDQIK